MKRPIRVLVVDDSLLFRELLVQNLNQNPDIEVVATAGDPYEARDAIIAYKPDVMTLDIELPRMSGLEFLRKLMPQYPLPVLVISALSDKVFDCIHAGAVDFVAKPSNPAPGQLQEFISRELPDKIRTVSTVQVSGRKKPKTRISPKKNGTGSVCNPGMVIAIGASTGGTEAIANVIEEFDTDIPGIVIVQHMPEGFTKMSAARLDRQCRIHVKEAKTGDVVQQGTALLAPGGDAHMELVEVNGTYQVMIKKGPKVNGHCPSVDVLFRSVARTAGTNALGIILTGMGADGAKGLLDMRHEGAETIGQDPSTCVVYGMPKVAYEIGAVKYQEKLPNIARKTYQLLHKA